MQKIKISQATDADWQDIEDIMKRVINTISDKAAFFTDHWEEIFQGAKVHGLNWVATMDDVAAGFLLIHLPGREEDNLGYDIGLTALELDKVAHMEVVAVLPEFRGHNLQRLLLEKAEPVLWQKGYRYLMATVYPKNEFSLNNFMKSDYRIIMTKKKYGGLDRHILCKELSFRT